MYAMCPWSASRHTLLLPHVFTLRNLSLGIVFRSTVSILSYTHLPASELYRTRLLTAVWPFPWSVITSVRTRGLPTPCYPSFELFEELPQFRMVLFVVTSSTMDVQGRDVGVTQLGIHKKPPAQRVSLPPPRYASLLHTSANRRQNRQPTMPNKNRGYTDFHGD